MKLSIFSGLLAFGLVVTASAQPAAFYVNDGIVVSPPAIPPQIDAINFVNNNYFSVNLTNLIYQVSVGPVPQFDMSDVQNFTNRGRLISNSGFRLDNSPSESGVRSMLSNYVNTGTIEVGSVHNTNLTYPGKSRLAISAMNLTHSGTNIMGENGLLTMSGKRVSLNRGSIAMENFNTRTNPITPAPPFPFCVSPSFSNEPGIFDSYWVGQPSGVFVTPCTNFSTAPFTTPDYVVAAQNAFAYARRISLSNAVTYFDQTDIFVTNHLIRIVIIGNTNSAIANNIYFRPVGGGFADGHTVVEWVAPATNSVTAEVSTNFVYLFDNFRLGSGFGSSHPTAPFFLFCTNLLATNSLVENLSGLSHPPTFRPMNYTFFTRDSSQQALLGTPVSPAFYNFPCGDQDFRSVFYSAYGVRFVPTTQIPDNLPFQLLTNLPGRVQITADEVLDLTRTRISGINYLGLAATNHFIGSSRAAIASPLTDVKLASTNGSLTITNLLAPTLPTIDGTVDMWSASWDQRPPGEAFEFHVLFVDSKLSPLADTYVQDLSLRSTNKVGGTDSMVISDIMRVTRSLKLDTARLTITTNEIPGLSGGEINVISSAITWPTSTPRLAYLTNNGVFRSLNAVFFGGSRTSPYYGSNYNEPYISFVNRGSVKTEGSLIWASYFENSGTFNTADGFGSISVDAQNARLTNGSFVTQFGDVSINADTLIVTNHAIQAGGQLTLGITNLLTDTGVSNANNWVVRGASLTAKPLTGDLKGTTIQSYAPAGTEVVNVWAGEDRGDRPDGFTNNVALGRLALDGGFDSQFTFTGTGASNAIYIDALELRGFMTNRDAGGNFVGLQIDSNMKVYFAQATINGTSVAEKMDKQNGGRLIWIPSYAGTYSGVNVLYPDGSTNFFNSALVTSCNLDSDGDGVVNCSDTTPVQRPQDLTLSVALMNGPTTRAKVSWQTGPYAVNTVYYKEGAGATNWQVLTNFSSGPTAGRVYIVDPVKTTSPRYYRVRVDANQP